MHILQLALCGGGGGGGGGSPTPPYMAFWWDQQGAGNWVVPMPRSIYAFVM